MGQHLPDHVTTMKHALALLIALAILPTAAAQTTGQAQAFVSLPHAVDLTIGANEVPVRVVAQLACEPGLSGPLPLQVVVASGAQGPNDGKGSAWSFTQTSWNFTWTQNGSNYTVDESFTATVTGQGYGTTGIAEEFSLSTSALRNAASTSCTTTGYSIPARSGHAHMQVGARPTETGKDAPGWTVGGVAVLLVALALVGRKP